MDIYCPQPGCGKVTSYTISKPTTCPKCQQPFAAAFKGVTAAVATPVAPRQVPTPAPVRKVMSVRPPPRAKERNDAVASSPSYMMPLDGSDLQGALPPLAPPPDDPSWDAYDGPVDEIEISSYADELQASIDPNAIRVAFADQPIRLHSIIPPEARR